ncbi:MAG: NYN domain-containing protein [Alphaproteobacteria bacterium]|nr:NYN domain-containing protein [Alphaproteobacteria bacterium]
METGFYKEERIGLFVDGANLYSAARSLGFDIDYKKLLDYFRDHGRMVRAFYYTALFDEQEYSPIRPLVDWLDYNGYTMVTKPAKEYTDSQGRRRVKGNMDIELAIDMLEMADRLEHIVLFSGDGDFRRLVEAVQRRGVRVTVVSTVKTSPPMIADELRRQADTFIELTDLSQKIARNFHDSNRTGYNRARPADSRSRPRPNETLDGEAYDDDDAYDDEYDDDEDYADDDAVVERV